MRLIDADAIEYDFNIKTYSENRTIVTSLLADKDTIDAMPTVNQWISVEDRLPDKKGYYLVTRKNPKGHVTRVRFNPEQVERGVYNSPWGNGDCDILAWMPLPEPYKSKDGGRA